MGEVRTLGPGSYVLTKDAFINQTADIKLIGNIEYRFKLFWILEGATFIDVGNIWTFRNDEGRPGGQFRFNSFLMTLQWGQVLVCGLISNSCCSGLISV